MKFKTKLSKVTADDTILRGEKLSELVSTKSFSDTIFFTLSGKWPNSVEANVFNALLVSSIDHGMGTASAMSARFVASTGNTINTAVASGVLALGNLHGGAIEKAMEQYASITNVESFVKDKVSNKKLIYGFGHKIHKEGDPRVAKLFSYCSKLDYKTKTMKLILQVETAIQNEKGKKIPINIDGFMAAVLLDMGFSPRAGRGIFIAARTPGLIAQACEEYEQKTVKRIDESDIEYSQ